MHGVRMAKHVQVCPCTCWQFVRLNSRLPPLLCRKKPLYRGSDMSGHTAAFMPKAHPSEQ